MTDNKLWCIHELGIVKDYDVQEFIERFYLSSVNVLAFSLLLVKCPIVKNDIKKVYELIKDYIFRDCYKIPFILNNTNEEVTIVLFELSDLEVELIVDSIESVIVKLLKNNKNVSAWGNGRVSGIIKEEKCLEKHMLEAKQISLLNMEKKMLNSSNFSFHEIKYLIEENRIILNSMLAGDYGQLNYDTILEMSQKLDELLVKYYNIPI